MDAVCREILLRADELGNQEIETIYIGGGTPSILPLNHYSDFFETLGKSFNLNNVVECTIEVNPEDVTDEFVEKLADIGMFNRVSMGVQSFDDGELQLLRRRHNSEKVVEAYEFLRESGFENISMDLIFGIPGQGVEDWRKNVESMLQLRPEHFSAYSMMYERGTLLWRMLNDGRVTDVDDDTYVVMCRDVNTLMREAGYEHYEISNYALPGFRSKHNSSYWKGVPYLGLGVAAHSFDGEKRRYNPNNVDEYVSKINAGIPCYIIEEENCEEKMNDFLLTRLRTSDGINFEEMSNIFGSETVEGFKYRISSYLESGKMELLKNGVRITEDGFMVSDMILRELFL